LHPPLKCLLSPLAIRIETGNVHPGINHGFDLRFGSGRGAQCGNNLGTTSVKRLLKLHNRNSRVLWQYVSSSSTCASDISVSCSRKTGRFIELKTLFVLPHLDIVG